MQQTQSCVVMAAGEYYDEPIALHEGDILIAADGGLDHARQAELEPDYVIGDFDSAQESERTVAAENDHVLVLPPQKDDPDLLSALKFGWSLGYRTFHIYGALGGRIDHTISALQITALVAQRGGTAILHGNRQHITALCDGSLTFEATDLTAITKHEPAYVSVFAHSDVAHDVTETGLKYGLEHAELSNQQVNGLSNELLNATSATVSVNEGTLLITYPAGIADPEHHVSHEFEGNLGDLDFSISAALRVH
ncbi:thiamine pyrophosphokinase [Bifidobacterium dolichotidis]|uniref:Thiamine diphosphokinase n=1 Tax=Bifidobacterium dolichotidis TaxID=2306976 RepID=A0A430FS58_9BIFI|nr:thiamine diphosphokinase [Bifidobacterium dolichotidis]RSX55722.1 thiamine pyrophosphokinase [Bifidobacterium dolichotidis]